MLQQSVSIACEKVGKKWPAYATIVSVGLLAAGAYKMYKAGTKVKEIVKTAEEEEAMVESALKNNPEEYSETDAENDRKIIAVQKWVKMAKAFAPGVALCALSAVGFVSSNVELAKRARRSAELAIGMERAYTEIRKRLCEVVGSEDAQMLAQGGKYREIKTDYIDGQGDKKTKSVRAIEYSPSKFSSPYATFFCDYCINFDPDSPRNNLEYLQGIEDALNRRLEEKGRVMYDELLNMLGIYSDPNNNTTRNAGWFHPKSPWGKYMPTGAPERISLGLISPNTRQVWCNLEPVVLIDPNCYQIGHLI